MTLNKANENNNLEDLKTRGSSTPAIVLKSVEFSYPNSKAPTICIEDLEVSMGQRVFIYGPSGSGKTTMLEILSGILVPQKGSVSILGVNLVSLSSSKRDQFRAKNMAYIFQSFNLLPYLNVKENILLPARLQGGSFDEVILNQQLKHLVDRLGLNSYLNQKVSKLSTGQQQRVAVARALLIQPKILFADEPTSSLDYDNREKFLQLLFELSEEINTTVLFVSHDRSLEKLFTRRISFQELNQNNSGVGQ